MATRALSRWTAWNVKAWEESRFNIKYYPGIGVDPCFAHLFYYYSYRISGRNSVKGERTCFGVADQLSNLTCISFW